jgi:hypothetical protein
MRLFERRARDASMYCSIGFQPVFTAPPNAPKYRLEAYTTLGVGDV